MLGTNYIKILRLNLTDKTISIERRDDLLRDYLGGLGIAAKLLEENVKPDKDPLDPGQPLIFAIGPMNTYFPVVSKVACTFRSPLTGNYGESHAGGRLAMSILSAGYDALVITGKSDRPVYLSITNSSLKFEDASYLWGRPVEETGQILRDREAHIGSGKRSIIRIGPAGEKLVRFAAVNVDTYRHFGRLGVGTVMGSKNLKAIAIGGNNTYHAANLKDYSRLFHQIFRHINSSPVMKKYHDLGTLQNILPLNAIKSLPTRNLKTTTFEHAEEISGESMAEELLLRKFACVSCPVACIHVGLLREQYHPGHDYQYKRIVYDYEPVYSLGPMIGVGDKKDILTLIDKVEEYGFDSMSIGPILSWMTEAYEKGLISEQQTGIPLAFGDVKSYLDVIDRIVRQENQFYKDIGDGVAEASKKYGGEDFALHVGKNEIAGYHTGYGALLGYAVGARQGHLDNAGYSFDQETRDYDFDKLILDIIVEEQNRDFLQTLNICLFARKVYMDKQLVSDCLKSLGINRTPEELIQLGERIWKLKNQIKGKLGFNQNDIKFSKRFFETETMHGLLDESRLYELMQQYIKKRDEIMESIPGL
ncbi:MAG: aldehyde ferredoxin oxidoreductase family protein [Dehalococcoidia bacterium]|nr:aldehyde ferredoxin oxidoreductase family protein [Dehalococcoidia bacterium]